jgi:hypothetical protein
MKAEGANMLLLQIRQYLGTTALSSLLWLLSPS